MILIHIRTYISSLSLLLLWRNEMTCSSLPWHKLRASRETDWLLSSRPIFRCMPANKEPFVITVVVLLHAIESSLLICSLPRPRLLQKHSGEKFTVKLQSFHKQVKGLLCKFNLFNSIYFISVSLKIGRL